MNSNKIGRFKSIEEFLGNMNAEELKFLEDAFRLGKQYGRFMDLSAEHHHVLTCEEAVHPESTIRLYVRAVDADRDAGLRIIATIDEHYSNVESARRIMESVRTRLDSLEKAVAKYR